MVASVTSVAILIDTFAQDCHTNNMQSTGNSPLPEGILKPMLCKDAPKDAAGLPRLPAVRDKWMMERKLDGWRFLFHVAGEGSVQSYGGRNGSLYDSAALDDLAIEIGARLPPGSIVDSEVVVVDGQHSAQVSTVLANPRAGLLRAVVFDVLMVNGEDVRRLAWKDRRRLLDVVSFDPYGPVRTSEVHPIDRAVYEQWLAEGAEGAVVKQVDHSYQSGKRSSGWLKLKPQATADAVIVSIEKGKGSTNRHVAGAFGIQMLDGDELGVLSSISVKDNAQALEAAEHPDRFLGRIIEIKHHGLFPSGVPRHPQFLRFREDREGWPTSQ